MQPRASSRLSQTPSSSNLAPSLKSKLEALQGKYNEFISNCSSLIQEDPKSNSQPYNKILKRRESHNEFFKESEKLRRENTFLTKVVTELSQKVSILETQQSESLVTKKFESQLETKKKHLDRQEQEMLYLQSELEKTRVELNSIKKQHKDNKVQRSRTPALQTSVTKSLLKLPKPKEYSPVSRNRMLSPARRSISPKERANHQKKVELSNLKIELQKTIEERNLYRNWKDYCSSHPPVPPGVSSIISHYEIELRRLTSVNSILRTKANTMERILKEAVSEIEKVQKIKRLKGFDDFLLNLKAKVKGVESGVSVNLDIEKVNLQGNDVLRLSSARMEKENKDLEEILRRENFISEFYNEVLKTKSEKVDEMRNTFSTVYSYDKSTVRPAEGLSENHSIMGTPFGKNQSFELSFAPSQPLQSPQEMFSLAAKEMESVFEFIETAVENKLESLKSLSQHFNKFQGLYYKKIEELNEKLLKKSKNSSELEQKLSTLTKTKEENIEKIESCKQALNDKEKYIESLKNLIMQEKDENLIRISINEELTAENLALKQSRQDTEKMLDKCKTEMQMLSKDLLKARENQKNSEKEAEEKLQDMQKLKDKAEILIENLKKDVENGIKRLEETKLQAKNDIKNYQSEIETYIQESKELKNLKKNETELKNCRDELKMCSEKIKELESVDQTNQDLKKRLENTKNDLETATSQLKSLQDELLRLKEKIDDHENEKIKHEKALTDLDEIKIKAQLLENEKSKNELLLVELEECRSKIQSLESENQVIESLKSELNSHKAQEKAFESEKIQFKILEKQLEDYLKQIELLDLETSRNKELEKNLEDCKSQLNIEKSQNNLLEKELESLNNTVENLRKNSGQLEEFNKQQSLINELVLQVENYKAEIQSLEKMQENSLKTVNELKKHVEEMELQILSGDSEILKLKVGLDEEINRGIVKDEKIADVELMLETRITENTGLKMEKVLLNEEISKKNTELKTLFEKSESEFRELKNNYSKTQSELSEMTQKFLALESQLLKKSKKCSDYKQKNINLQNSLENQESETSIISDQKHLIFDQSLKINSLQQSNSALQSEKSSALSDLSSIKSIFDNFSSSLESVSHSKFSLLLEKLSSLSSKIQLLKPKKPSPYLSIDSTPTLSLLPDPSLSSFFSELFNLPLTTTSLEALHKLIKEKKDLNFSELSEKNYLLETAYKKLAEEIISYKSAVQEKMDDLKLDKYELAKENDDLKKRMNCEKEDSKQLKLEINKLESEKKEIWSQKTELDLALARQQSDLEEKTKKITEQVQEISNSNNYVQKILKEKESVERDLANLVKNTTLDNSQIRNEISVLQAHITNLDTLNTSLEKSKSQLEQRLKQALKEKSEIVERQEELNEEIEGLKQIRSKQASQIDEFENSNLLLRQELENDKKQLAEYKNKLATYMCNTTALQRELRSMTPPPKKISEENKTDDCSPTRICHTADSVPKASVEKTLEKLKNLVKKPTPNIVLDWCKDVLGKENFIVRFQENASGVSDESKSSVSDISSVSEANIQEGNYRAHAKILEQRKSLQKMQARLTEKKQRIKVFKGHIKSLQEEIRKLDSQLKSQKTFDIEYLKITIQKFVENLKNLDGESLKIVQIIYSQLGIRGEVLQRVESKSKWNIFSKKPLNKYV